MRAVPAPGRVPYRALNQASWIHLRALALITLNRGSFVRYPAHRYIHTSQPRVLSLADRIKEWLPADATLAPNTSESLDDIVEAHDNRPVSLAAYETELVAASKLVTQYKFTEGCELLMSDLPLNVLLNALVEKLVPIARSTPLGDLGVIELVYALYASEQEGLATQVLQALRMKISLHGLEIIHRLSDHPRLSTRDMDSLLSEVLEDGQHFPQILDNRNVSLWFRLRLLAHLDERSYAKWISRYGSSFGSESLGLLSIVKPEYLKITLDEAMGRRDPTSILSIIKTARTRAQFRPVYNRLVREFSNQSASQLLQNAADELAPALLMRALRLDLSYDIANICKVCASSLAKPRHESLLADALLAVAFAQKRPNDIFEAIIKPQEDLCTFLVSKVLTPVSGTPAVDSVVSKAAARLADKYHHNVPGKVLWNIVLSVGKEVQLGPQSSIAFARLMASRPYVEQIRFMALPNVSVRGISELLKQHISMIVEHRIVNAVGAGVPQAEEDIQLIAVGILLASERQEFQKSGSGKNDLMEAIKQVFESSDELTASNLIREVSEASIESVSASVASNVVNLLIEREKYDAAQQLLRIIGPSHFPNQVLNNLLRSAARDIPDESYKIAQWLVQADGVRITGGIINEMLYIVATSSNMSESQLMNRFKSLRLLLYTKLGKLVQPKPAIALVNALIRSSLSRQGGSRMRLRWAFVVAKHAGVDDAQFAAWEALLEEMRTKRLGYWYKSG